MYNQNITEGLSQLGSIPPASQSVAAHSTAAIGLKNSRRLLFAIHVGAISGGATVDFKVQACATSGGSYADVAGAAITQITSGAETIVFLEVKAESLQSLGVGPYVKGVLTVGTAVCVAGVICYGGSNRYDPASDFNAATTTQIVQF